jgi:hypothetical protein
VTRSQYSSWLFLSLLVLVTLAIMELRLQVGAGSEIVSTRQGGPLVQEAPVPRFALADRETFSETLTRPLFMANRQPPAIAATESNEPASRAAKPEPNRYALSAIIIVDDERVALLTDTATGGLSRVKEGESVPGWQVAEIREESAVLTDGDIRKELELRSFGPPPPPRPRNARTASQRQPSGAVSDAATANTPKKRPRRPRRRSLQFQRPSENQRN